MLCATYGTRRFFVKNVSSLHCQLLCLSKSLQLNAPVHAKKFNQLIKKKYKEQHARQLRNALGMKKRYPLVDVPPKLTVAKLAEITNAAEDRVIDAVASVNGGLQLKRGSVLFDRILISQTLKVMGFRCNWQRIEKPKLVEDMDVYRSVPTTDKSRLSPRPPIVTIMGHIDHGKTTLLDALRNTNVAKSEAGGITQAVGAFTVALPNGKMITFLDTPGHAAFSSMRKRGAQLTDVVVLVVAADDGVMEQTVESILATKLAGVPMVVAVNKCDLPNVNPEKVFDDLVQHGVTAEQLGGGIQTVKISAINRKGISDLVECILLQADILDVSADKTANVEGVVLESRMEQGVGPVTSAVIQQGTLTRGKWLVAGTCIGKVKGLHDEKRKSLASAFPGYPVDIFGWKQMPHAGDVIIEVQNESQAKRVLQWRTDLQRKEKELIDSEIISEKRNELKKQYTHVRRTVLHKVKRLYEIQKFVRSAYVKKDIPEYNVVLKADVDGSLDVLLNVLDSYDSEDQCVLNVTGFSVGEIQKTDVERASTCKGAIFAFNVAPSENIKAFAEEKGVDIISNDVIYHLINNLKEEITAILPSQTKTDVIGEAKVVATFESSEAKNSLVAGCTVEFGELQKDLTFLLLRDGEVLFQGSLHSMRIKKTDVVTVGAGKECGIILGDEIRPQIDDVIQCCELNETEAVLKWNPPGF